jgi:mannosyl-3-phosphoglycerate phosphatase
LTAYIVFTDLDGTLLDHDTYSWEPARPALKLLQDNGVPLIMVSSKTRPEIESLRRKIGNRDPFIVENGGAIFIPSTVDLGPVEGSEEYEDGAAIVLGRRAEEIAPLFDRLAEEFRIRALSRLPASEVSELTGLSPEQARSAGAREFGEAFVFDGPEPSTEDLDRAVSATGLRWTRGGRFYHLLGENDKGRAVEILSDLYRRGRPGLVTAACGDAPNDQPMLAAVDHGFLVAKPGGGHADVEAPGLIRVPQPGPSGFNQAVFSLLDEKPPP